MRVTKVTPKTMVMSRGRSGRSAGRASTAAMERAPLMLPNTIACCQRRGTTSRRVSRSSAKQPYTAMARPT